MHTIDKIARRINRRCAHEGAYGVVVNVGKYRQIFLEETKGASYPEKMEIAKKAAELRLKKIKHHRRRAL